MQLRETYTHRHKGRVCTQEHVRVKVQFTRQQLLINSCVICEICCNALLNRILELGVVIETKHSVISYYISHDQDTNIS